MATVPNGYIRNRQGDTNTHNMTSNDRGVSEGSNSGITSAKVLVLRNLTVAEDSASKRSVYSGVVSVDQIVDINTNDNVRGYLAETGSVTKVHRAIKETLKNNPSVFHVLNGGLTIVAAESVYNETTKELRLSSASIINGAQTQGVIKEYIVEREEMAKKGGSEDLPPLPSVHFQLIVTQDEALIAEISIARNSQNSVKNISIVGSKGMLDELEEVMRSNGQGNIQLREDQDTKSGTYLPTEKLLQVIMALVPDELPIPGRSNKDPSKTYCYSQKSACLTNFSNAFEQRAKTPAQEALYRFFIDIAPAAWALYTKWQKHQGFKGTGLRSLERDDSGNILEVPDGIIFPIIAAHSAFVAKDLKGKWRMEVPEKADKILIDTAKSDYMEVASHNPQTMGKSKACYTRLKSIAELIRS
jgi:hypothetical protein